MLNKPPYSSTETLINALRALARDIVSEDGAANAAIAEAAERLDWLDQEVRFLHRNSLGQRQLYMHLHRDVTAQHKANRIKKRKLRAMRAALRALRPATALTANHNQVTPSVTQGHP